MQMSPVIFGDVGSSQRCYDDVKELADNTGFFPVLKVGLLVLSDNISGNTRFVSIYFVRDNRDIIIEPGLAYGHIGTGPRLLKDTLHILMKHGVKTFHTVQVSEKEYESVRSGKLDIQSLPKWDRFESESLLEKWYLK